MLVWPIKEAIPTVAGRFLGNQLGNAQHVSINETGIITAAANVTLTRIIFCSSRPVRCNLEKLEIKI